MDTSRHSEHERFFGAAKLIAGLTLVSRVLGMVRDIAITSLGATRLTSAFVLAFKVPNLFRRLFGEGALSAAFVPVFCDVQERSGMDKAARLLANAAGLLALLLTGVAVAVGAGVLVWAALPHTGDDQRLLLRLLALMLPFSVTICLLALGSAALQCRGHFTYPALAPILLNVFVIAAAWGIAPACSGQVAPLYILAGSVTLAGVVQLVALLPILRRDGLPIRPMLRPVQPGIGQMLRLLLPMLLGLGFLQISELLTDIVAWVLSRTPQSETITILGHVLRKPLDAGVLMRVYAAQRLYQFPLGVLAIPLGIAVFPLMSRCAARGDLPGMRIALNRALRLAMMEGLAAGTGLWLLAGPITSLIYRHGDYRPEDVAVSAFVLKNYALGMWAFATYQIFVRGFYSLKDTRTPLWISCGLIVPNVALVAGLVWAPALRAGAFGLATTITFTLNVLILATLLRRRVGLFGGRALLTSVARSAVACAVMAGAVVLLRRWMGSAPAWRIVLACVPAGAVAFILTARLLRAPELGELLRKAPANEADPQDN